MGTRSISSPRLQISFTSVLENLLSDGSTDVEVTQNISTNTTLTSGTTSGKADRIWISKGRTLASGASETIDVYDLGSIDIGAGAGKDALGQSWALAEAVGLIVLSASTSVGTLAIGGEGSTATWASIFGASDTAYTTIGPGGALVLYRPDDPAYAVADATNHLLKMAASGGAVTYSIAIIGRSA
jgi:hypothetical protein